MDVKRDLDGCLMCPVCDVGMNHEGSMGRDIETMGGHYIQYYRCDDCNQSFQLISGFNGYEVLRYST
jgi:transposase-like protein